MIQDKSVVAIIPARGGSKGVPRKNLRVVNGQSLLSRTVAEAKLSTHIDRVIVSSEDSEIIQEAKLVGAEVPFIRPLELSQDDTAGIEPILHALTQLPYYDYVVVLQVTSPLRQFSDIDECIHLCFTQNAPACVSVSSSDMSPYWMFSMKNNHTLSPLIPGQIPSNRQNLPTTYALNGAIYVAKTSWLQQYQHFLSEATIGYIMPKERSIDIDTEFDFKLLDIYLGLSI